MKPILKKIREGIRRRMRGDRRGSALILTLAMLTIIIVFFISFSLIAIYNQRNAKLSESLVQARLHCQTGLEMFYSQVSTEWQNPSADTLFPASDRTQSYLVIPDASNPWGGRRYWVSNDVVSGHTAGIEEAFHMRLAGQDFTPDPDSAFLESTGLSTWIPIQAEVDGEQRIVGRISFLVIDESGKIDPGAVIDSSVAEGAETNKLGKSSTEIDMSPIFTDATLGEKFQYVGVGAGELPTGITWFSYYHMLKGNSSAASLPDEVIKGKVFPFSIDIDAYNADVTVDTSLVPTAKHRFDLNQDWDTIDSSVIDSAAADLYYGTDSVTLNKSGIPWLANGYDAALKDQIIANLIDYCDADSASTTDNIDSPTYCGLEMTPYINEFLLGATVVNNGTDYDLQVTVYPELIYCYEEAFTEDGTLTVEIQPAVNGLTDSTAQQLVFNLTNNWSSSPSDGSRHYAFGSQAATWNIAGGANTLADFSVNINSAKLTNAAGTELWDFSFTDPAMPLAVAASVDEGVFAYMSVEANDPRANLGAGDWIWSTSWEAVPSAVGDGIAGSLGDLNDMCSPNAGGSQDAETTTKPWEVSTMFIRNATMESLWELGAIHRGSPWQTLNLSTYNNTGSSGFSLYSEGDANILDQVKLTETGEDDQNIVVRGRVNANTYHKEVVQALLSRITIGAEYNNPAPSGSEIRITAAQAAEVAQSSATAVGGEWLYENGATDAGGEPFTNRGMIAKVTELSDDTLFSVNGLSQDNDRAKEEVICKVVGLLTVRPNFFTVIVTAQAIEERPSSYPEGAVLTYDEGIDKILAEQRLLAVVRRDGHTNDFQLLRLEYLDE